MAELLQPLKARFFDSNGNPLSGGKLYSYIAGTSTPLATFTDKSGLAANTNPVILDANGEADVWTAAQSYKFVLMDADDVVQWTVDNVRNFQAQYNEIINAEGALAITANLSDLDNPSVAVTNLGLDTFISNTNSHIDDMDNPHGVTAAQVGNDTAQWNADKLQGRDIEVDAPIEGDVLTWNSATSKWEGIQPGGVDLEVLTTRVDTAESDITDLENAAANYVTLDGDQTIAGTKSFDKELIAKELAAKPANPPTGYTKFYRRDAKWFGLDSDGNEIELGSGGGSGGINYASNPDFETGVTDVTVTANITRAEETVTPIRKSKSLKLTIGTSATTADYIDIPLKTFAKADTDKSKLIWVEFEYYNDANFSSGDLEVVLRNNTGSVDIPVQNSANGEILYSAKTTKFQGICYTTESITNYSLRIKVKAAPSVAANIVIDSVKVGPQCTVQSEYTQVEYVYNSSGITAAGTSDTSAFATGEDGALIGSIDSVTTTGLSTTQMRVQFSDDILPDDIISLQIKRDGSDYWVPISDNAPVQTYAALNAAAYGMGSERVSGANNQLTVLLGNAGRTTAGATYGTAGATWAGMATSRWRVARYRKKSAVLSTTEVNLKNSIAIATTAAGQAIDPAGSVVDFGNVAKDIHNNITTGSGWRYTADEDADYEVKVKIRYANGLAWTAGNWAVIQIGKNGSPFRTIAEHVIESTHTYGSVGIGLNGSLVISLNRGEYIDVRLSHAEGTSRALLAAGSFNHVSIEKKRDLTYFGVYGEKEVVEATVTPAVSFPASGVYGDATSIELTPGEWEIRLFTYVQTLSTNTNVVVVGIGTVSGNDSTGVDNARNRLRWATTSTALDLDLSGSLIWRTTITSTTTYYVKMLATYSSGTPICQVNVSARRIS